ncbi:Protein CBG25355 [Caenorhabditis briggsae]|uniref:Homeobox domain-containing protein n=2 Tax=Caenorhabditis briggsae TaxID=6238 RepID=A0AAE9E465_CAEBR|nr:Protein CBG25355 [Caenorhabditis briggsae]UMM13659.1 hypothetical protein L5515_001822 [Caenorhabditis briggsae]CAR99749.1 Protein CBG25355 [Caenorhabditis briggsae]
MNPLSGYISDWYFAYPMSEPSKTVPQNSLFHILTPSENSRLSHSPSVTPTPMMPQNVIQMDMSKLQMRFPLKNVASNESFPYPQFNPEFYLPPMTSQSIHQNSYTANCVPSNTPKAVPSRKPRKETFERRRRTAFSEKQLKMLCDQFMINQNPTGFELNKLAKDTELEQKTVKIWFKNRRAAWRKQNPALKSYMSHYHGYY